MSDATSRPSYRNLAKVVVDNFVFMFFFSGGFGFTLSALGLLQPDTGIYRFTIAFSTLWGFVGAAAAWSRANENIQIPRLFESLLKSALGGKGDKNYHTLALTCHDLRLSIVRRVYIPFVQTPKCGTTFK